VWATWRSSKRFVNSTRRSEDPGRHAVVDFIVALWGVVSIVAVMAGEGIYWPYLFHVLPAASPLVARGGDPVVGLLLAAESRTRAQSAAAAMAILFIFGLVRFHHRTALLAYEQITGARTVSGESLGMSIRAREADVVSEYLRNPLSSGEPLYIWGYAQDV